MNEELWKDIAGYEGLYQVSNMGQVKRLCTKVNAKNNSTRIKKEKILKKATYSWGYEYVCLSVNVKREKKKVHRLVAETFIPNPNNLPQVNHINGVKNDNRVSNLEWCNNSENMKHMYRLKKISVEKVDDK